LRAFCNLSVIIKRGNVGGGFPLKTSASLEALFSSWLGLPPEGKLSFKGNFFLETPALPWWVFKVPVKTKIIIFLGNPMRLFFGT